MYLNVVIYLPLSLPIRKEVERREQRKMHAYAPFKQVFEEMQVEATFVSSIGDGLKQRCVCPMEI